MTCWAPIRRAFTAPPTWFVMVNLVVLQVGFSGYGIVLKAFAKDTNPVVLSLIRDGCCFPLMMLAAYAIEGKTSPKPKDIALFSFLGLMGMFGNQLLFILGLYYTSSNIASLFQPAIPVFTSLLSILTKTEPLPSVRTLHGCARIFGILCATGGAATMIAGKGLGSDDSSDGSSSTDLLVGNMFLLGNTLCMSIYILAQKRFVFAPHAAFGLWSKYPMTVTAWAYLSGTICMGFASFYYIGREDYSVFSLDTDVVVPLLYAIFISSMLCYGLISWANKHVPSSIVTAFWPVQIPVTVVLSYAAFGDTLEAVQYVGGSLIVLGLLAVTWSYHKQAQIEAGELEEQKGPLINPVSQKSVNVRTDDY